MNDQIPNDSDDALICSFLFVLDMFLLCSLFCSISPKGVIIIVISCWESCRGIVLICLILEQYNSVFEYTSDKTDFRLSDHVTIADHMIRSKCDHMIGIVDRKKTVKNLSRLIRGDFIWNEFAYSSLFEKLTWLSRHSSDSRSSLASFSGSVGSTLLDRG